MNIAVLGTGYVGLVTGVCLSEKGHKVVCLDVDEAKIQSISRKITPIHEEGLQELLERHVGKELTATTDLQLAICDSEVIIIAVGTPFDGQRIDLKYIIEAARQLGEIIRTCDQYKVIVVKSTVVPGTTEEIVMPIIERASKKSAGRDFGLAMNPEFLREGKAIEDFMNPDRIVIGAIDERAMHTVKRMYEGFPGVDFVLTDPRTAEMIKYASNSFLATAISFSNEIANLCATIPPVDVKLVMQGLHLDKRISPILADGSRLRPEVVSYLEAGCGFGGSCFPKDVSALISFGRERRAPMRILEAVMEVNRGQPLRLLDLLGQHYQKIEGLRVTVLGLAFKPGTDDIRESPAIPLINGLLKVGARVTAYDPVASGNAMKVLPPGKITYHDDLITAIADAEAIIIVTAWEEFKRIPELLGQTDPKPLVIDGRRILNPHLLANYAGIGLGKREQLQPAGEHRQQRT